MDASAPERGFRHFRGEVTTTAASDAFGTLYVVRYEDGDEEELSYEELLPALVVDADERWSPVPRDVSEAAEKLSVWKVQTMNKGLGHGRRNFRGVCAADPPEAGFVAWVTDDAGEDHVFDFLFLTRWGAAAAHDLMLRRIQHGSGARKAQSYDPNFPNASWSDLCAVVLFAAANDARVVAKNVAPPASETKRKRKKTLDDSEAVVDGALTTPAKRKKRNAKEPHRHVVGRRVYDSELGVTCHWCRQKTTDPRVRCVLKSCAESASRGKDGRAVVKDRLPVAFCEGCLRNRHGEDVHRAAASNAWVCPKCRGSCGPGCCGCCNCGPCRAGAGAAPTGQRVREAGRAGFDNVHDYLVHLETGETPAQFLDRKKAHWWGAWLLTPEEASERRRAERARLLPDANADADADTAADREAGGRGRGRPLALGACASAVADVRAALGDARGMLEEGLIDRGDYARVKGTVLARFTAAA